ncbi:hypothetical protein [Glycomyces salinus]|uniref:hypothetical protein n=1 Tax=Glycomyces salinus TaxID=980294 RepID=UPI0018EBE5F0|nr:hypothetical protein [Glycomyces salinus]
MPEQHRCASVERKRIALLTSKYGRWAATAEANPPIFGYLTGRPSGSPLLQITDQAQLAWTRAGNHSEQLKRAGLEVWREAQRWCEG